MGKITLIAIFLIFFLVPFVSASTNNVINNYPFDSNFSDRGQAGVDLTVTGSPGPSAYVQGQHFKIGNGSAFINGTGTAKFFSGGSQLVPTHISLATWINWTAPSGSDPIFSYSGDSGPEFSQWTFNVLANGTLEAIQRVDSTQLSIWRSDGATIPTNVWTHVGITQNEHFEPTFYVNGASSGATLIFGNVTGSSKPTNMSLIYYVGGLVESGITAFSGNIDEFSRWDKVLTDADYIALYNAGAGAEFPFTNSSNQNFSVAYNSTNNFAVTTKVTMQENSSDFNYKYALSCNIIASTLWNEQFNQFYNFTTQNVSTSFANPESYLTFNGITWNNVVGVTTNFDIQKNGNLEYRDYLKLEVQYQTNQDHYADFIAYDSSNNPGLYLTLNKTGSLLIVGQYFPAFSTNINIANFTLTGGNVALAVQLTPHYDNGQGVDDFTFTITNNDETGVQTQPNYETIGGVAGIRDVELFVGNRFNGTTNYKRLALSRTNNPTPAFTEFQNGERENINNVIIEVPAPNSEINGDGFTVIPDFNNVFYSICQYSGPGPFTQRHFISPTSAADDYTNFHDLVITAAQVTTNTTDETEGGNAGPGSGDFGTDTIPSFFASIGFTSTASKLLIWFFIAFIIAAIAFGVHPALGVLVFVGIMLIGVPIGMVPIWFLLIFVIIAAGIVALLYRMIFSGS